MEVIIDIGGGNGEESPKSEGREDFIGGGVRHNKICVSGRAVVSGEAQWRRGDLQRSGANWY